MWECVQCFCCFFSQHPSVWFLCLFTRYFFFLDSCRIFADALPSKHALLYTHLQVGMQHTHTHTFKDETVTQEVKTETVKGRAWLNWAVFLPCHVDQRLLSIFFRHPHTGLLPWFPKVSDIILKSSTPHVAFFGTNASLRPYHFSLIHSLKTHIIDRYTHRSTELTHIESCGFSIFLNLITANWSAAIRSDYIH